MPYLPYGAKGPLTRIQQIILLRFISVQDNYNNLKVIEGGTQVELADTYKDLKVLPCTPSGYTNLYSAIPYYFPAVVKLTTTSALSDALLGR